MTLTNTPKINALAHYKTTPARIFEHIPGLQIGIELPDGNTAKVRSKDITVLHPGPVPSLNDLRRIDAISVDTAGSLHGSEGESPTSVVRLLPDLADACELLAGETVTLEEFVSLAGGGEDVTPAQVWAVVLLAMDGLMVTPASVGGADSEEVYWVRVATPEEVQEVVASRNVRAAERAEWDRLMEALRRGKVQPEDHNRLTDVENLALGRSERSRILRELKAKETQESAHALLLKWGVWTMHRNPQVERFGFSRTVTYPEIAAAGEEDEVQEGSISAGVKSESGSIPVPGARSQAGVGGIPIDFTHLSAYAIDDQGNTDPDDAISLDGEVLWIHVADAAAMITPDSPADQLARTLGATLYIPEGKIPMLPAEAYAAHCLGLQDVSTAMSFGIILDPESAEIASVKVVLSKVRVTRITYDQVNELIQQGDPPFHQIFAMTQRYRERRYAAGAVELVLPEVRIRVVGGDAAPGGDDAGGQVVIEPLLPGDAKQMVADAMVMAGEGAAAFALEHAIPFPFSSQQPPDAFSPPVTLADMFAVRGRMRAGEVRSVPDVHAGLGLSAYSRVTSPLRRYIDLLAHQQLRGWLKDGVAPLSDEQMMERVAVAYESMRTMQRIERASNFHWTMVYLLQHPDWEGDGTVVGFRGQDTQVVIPELGLETTLTRVQGLQLDQVVRLRVDGVDIPKGFIRVGLVSA